MPNDEHEGPTVPSQDGRTTVVSIQEGTRARTQNDVYSDPVHLDVRDAWETVRIGIEEILYQNQQLTFRPEDVYVELIEN